MRIKLKNNSKKPKKYNIIIILIKININILSNKNLVNGKCLKKIN